VLQRLLPASPMQSSWCLHEAAEAATGKETTPSQNFDLRSNRYSRLRALHTRLAMQRCGVCAPAATGQSDSIKPLQTTVIRPRHQHTRSCSPRTRHSIQTAEHTKHVPCSHLTQHTQQPAPLHSCLDRPQPASGTTHARVPDVAPEITNSTRQTTSAQIHTRRKISTHTKTG
jgi:hypothetical protein